jgi:hypothetical protein
MTRSLRSATAVLAVAATLFAPFALALHACMIGMDAPAAVSGAAGMPATHATQQVPADDAVLCERHCNENRVSFQTLATPPSPMAIAVVPALRVDALEPVSLRAPAFDSPFAPAIGPAPPLIRFSVLRL